MGGRGKPAGTGAGARALDGPGAIVHLPAVRFSLQVQYAICGMFDLAYNGHAEPVQVRVVSERQGIPARYLEQIFGRLRRAGVVASKRGPGGGYTIARPPGAVTLRAIVEAVEGPLDKGLQMNDEGAVHARAHRPDFLWSHLADRIGAALDDVTLETLCLEAAQEGIPRAEAEAPMYFI